MKTIFIILFLFISSLGFAQLKQVDDSTYSLSKKDVDRLYNLMVDYKVIDELNKNYKAEIEADSVKIFLLNNSLEKKDSIILIKDRQLDSAQSWISFESILKEKFWQGLNLGAKAESLPDNKIEDLKSFAYSLFIDVGFRFNKLNINPGINLYLSGQKPTYFISIKYKLF